MDLQMQKLIKNHQAAERKINDYHRRYNLFLFLNC
jgi:hypothetical protein